VQTFTRTTCAHAHGQTNTRTHVINYKRTHSRTYKRTPARSHKRMKTYIITPKGRRTHALKSCMCHRHARTTEISNTNTNDWDHNSKYGACFIPTTKVASSITVAILINLRRGSTHIIWYVAIVCDFSIECNYVLACMFVFNALLVHLFVCSGFGLCGYSCFRFLAFTFPCVFDFAFVPMWVCSTFLSDCECVLLIVCCCVCGCVQFGFYACAFVRVNVCTCVRGITCLFLESPEFVEQDTNAFFAT